MLLVDIEDPSELLSWLRGQGHLDGESHPTISVLSGGVSNKTVFVRFADGRAWVLKQALPKLRVKDDWFSDVRRIGNEAKGLRWLEKLAPPGTTTPLVFESPPENLLAMQAVAEPHANLKSVLMNGKCPRESVLNFAEQMGRLLGTIQANSHRDDVRDAFADCSFFESLRLDPYYAISATRVPESAEFYAELIGETRSTRSTLVHGDFSPKNILIHNATLILLDHEVIHFGDGAFDVGFALTHLLSKSLHVAQRRIDYRDAALAFWRTYRTHERSADELRCVRHTIGCLLARVAGKSPLEYLLNEERTTQQRRALAMMRSLPTSVEELIHGFTEPAT